LDDLALLKERLDTIMGDYEKLSAVYPNMTNSEEDFERASSF
jgi:hypothetical protein